MDKKEKKNIEKKDEEINVEEKTNSEETESDRKIVVPGEVIESGSDFLPGEGTRREGKDIVSIRFGLLDMNDKLIKVIPLSGAYVPRPGNVVIGQVYDMTFNGWLIDIASPFNSFLSAMEVGRFVNKNDLSETLDFRDIVVAKIKDIKSRGIDLTMRERGLKKLEGGMLIRINSAKVPRVIGKAGSMVSMLKQETGTNIIVGQNGIIWIGAESVENELLAKKAIEFIAEKPFIHGLSELVKKFLDDEKKKMKITIKPVANASMEDN